MPSLSEFNPVGLLLIALLNPVVIIVAVLMGRSADQWQKLLVAAFAASLAGVVFIWFATFVGLLEASGFGGTGGLLIAQMFFGFFWALGAHWFARRGSA